MSLPCRTCNGVGRIGPSFEDACSDCAATLEGIKKDERSITILDDHGKVKEKLDPKTMTLGAFKPLPDAAQVRAMPQRKVAFDISQEKTVEVSGDGTDAYGAGFSPEQVERSAR